MKYFKNNNNKLYVDPNALKHDGLIEISESEFNAMLSSNGTTKTENQKLDDIDRARYIRETADLEYNGLLIKMDQLSITKIDSAMNKIRRGVVDEIEWHCRNGYLMFNSVNIVEIELLAVQQIQAAFDWAKAEKGKIQVN